MFKKRRVKGSGAKRTRDDVIEDNDVEINIKSVKKDNSLDSTNTDKSDTETSSDKEDKSNESNIETEKDIFKPDTMIDELHQKLKENEKLLSGSKEIQKKDADGNKLYTGMISTKSKKEVLVKPVSSHVKQSFVVDYQRDVCKDFLKLGYCGFGDTCKFLHYREEFQPNEKEHSNEWEMAAKKKRRF